MIDIAMISWRREEYTLKSVTHLIERTSIPFRLIMVINEFDRPETRGLIESVAAKAGKHGMKGNQLLFIANNENEGLPTAKNQALEFVESDIYIDTDNDILCPFLEPCWLTQLLALMDSHSDFAAIALRTHIFVADGNFFFGRTEPVVERNHVGGSLRAMKSEEVRRVGGWVPVPGRGSEERDICGKLRRGGWKVGYTREVISYHMFGRNWGYEDLPAKEHGHSDRLAPTIHTYDRNLDPNSFKIKEK